MRDYGNERIKLDMSMMDVVAELSEGVPGALVVCMRMLKDGDTIDPDNMLGGVGSLLSLDSQGIYGSRIWMLYKDVCGEDLTKTIALLRATQLGFVSDTDLDHAVDNRGAGVDVDALYAQVQERLPAFGG